MITTTAPLLDIAVEAGYGSHEAFTRAFTKAYGETPAAWRKKPVTSRSPRPRRPLPPTRRLRLPAETRSLAMDLLKKMVEHHIWLTGEMVRSPAPHRRAARRAIEPNVDDDRQPSARC